MVWYLGTLYNITCQYIKQIGLKSVYDKRNEESRGLQAFDSWKLFSLSFYASQFLVNYYHWLKWSIVLEDFV